MSVQSRVVFAKGVDKVAYVCGCVQRREKWLYTCAWCVWCLLRESIDKLATCLIA